MKHHTPLTLAIARQTGGKHRRHPADEEHRLQTACVRWFRLTHPAIAHALFAVPNGGRRDAVTGARLKAEGVLAGVADLILLRSNARHGALLIELKTPRGRQSPAQRDWQRRITAGGEYKYAVIRTLDEFRREVTEYLADGV